jgi:F-type H+-transporting ATPase subunit c
MSSKKKRLIQLFSFVFVMALTATAFAQGEDGKAARDGWLGLGAGLGIGIAAFGGALGQGKAAAAALDGIARNPGAADRVFTPLILGLAFMESLVILAFLINFLIQNRIGT